MNKNKILSAVKKVLDNSDYSIQILEIVDNGFEESEDNLKFDVLTALNALRGEQEGLRREILENNQMDTISKENISKIESRIELLDKVIEIIKEVF